MQSPSSTMVLVARPDHDHEVEVPLDRPGLGRGQGPPALLAVALEHGPPRPLGDRPRRPLGGWLRRLGPGGVPLWFVLGWLRHGGVQPQCWRYGGSSMYAQPILSARARIPGDSRA